MTGKLTENLNDRNRHLQDLPIMGIKEFRSQLLSEINAVLEHYSVPGAGCPERLCQAIRYNLLGAGKRLRPLLTLLACELCGGERKKALTAAAAVEMVHAYSLIHDDLPAMDNDSLRRGRPTTHVVFDEATAILTGDALLTLAFELLSGTIKDEKVSLLCCRILARAAGSRGMVGGQEDDTSYPQGIDLSNCVTQEQRNSALTDHLVMIHQRKTGALILAALRMGATIARADFQQIMALDEFGSVFGLAFQITDDILDATADPMLLGKSIGKDEKEGKLTYVSLLGLEKSRQLAHDYADQAIDALRPFDKKCLAGQLLIDITSSICSRIK